MTYDELKALLDDKYDDVISATLKQIERKAKNLTVLQLAQILYVANKIYWTERLAIIDVDRVYSAEKAATAITAAYQSAGKALAQELKSIYGNYTAAFHLTHKEADNLLKHVVYDRSVAENLQALADRLPAGEEKDKILAEISAPAYRYRMQRVNEMTRQAQETTNEIARAETNADRLFLQTETERAYNITIEEAARKSPADAVIENIQLRAEEMPKSEKVIQEFTPTTEKGIGDSFTLLNTRAVKEMTNRDWSGENFSSRIWANTDELALEVKRVLLEGELTGASEAKMSAQIMKRFDVAAYKARRVIRTEHNYCVNQAEKKALIDAGYDSYEFMSLHEAGDCDICDSLDGNVYKFDDAVVGVNFPPIHPFCRCSIAAPTKTEAQLDAEIEEILQGRTLEEYLASLPPV